MDKAYKTTCKEVTKTIIAVTGILGYLPIILADVTFDGTTGYNGTLTDPNMEITKAMGIQEGGNLFHSFSDFNVKPGQTAKFTGPENVQNIIGRVTGSNPSDIQGTISSSIVGANLFLMNPNGILFGPNATIDVKGSFHATTADYIKLDDQQRFYADINQNITLSSAAPAAFGFLDENTADITINGSKLQGSEGNSLSIVGGNVNINHRAKITTSDGQTNLASTRSAGEFATNLGQTDLDQFVTLGTINISEKSNIDASGDKRAKVVIRGGVLVMDLSSISSTSKQVTDPSSPENINIHITEEMFLKNGSLLWTSADSSANAGDINISGNNILLTDNAKIESSVKSLKSNSGNINIASKNLEIRNGAYIASRSSNKSGSISIDSEVSFLLDGVSTRSSPPEFHTSLIRTNGSNKSGNIDVKSSNILIKNGAKISTENINNSKSGDISLIGENISITGVNDALYTLLLDIGLANDEAYQLARTNVSTFSRYWEGLQADNFESGKITIQSNSLDVSDGAMLSSRSQGSTELATSNNAGDILVESKNVAILNGGVIESNSDFGGNAGDIIITSESITMENNSSQNIATGIFSTSSSSVNENALPPTIQLSTKILNMGVGSQINSSSTGIAKGGDLHLHTNNLTMSGSTINSSSASSGDAGNISINSGQVNMKARSNITTRSNTANGGEIEINASNGIVVSESTIESSVSNSNGNGGNISIRGDIVALISTLVSTSAVEGNGGDITINAGNLIISDDTVLDASSELSVNGKIQINILNKLDDELEKLPDEKDSLPIELAGSCSLNNSIASTLKSTVTFPFSNSAPFSASNYFTSWNAPVISLEQYIQSKSTDRNIDIALITGSSVSNGCKM